MESQVPHPESVLERPPPAALILGIAGVMAGLLVYALALSATMAWVPRVDENSRFVVNISWPLYATLPTLIAAAIAIGIGFAVMGSRRIAFWIGASVSLAICSCIGISLLRRDFIGKF